MTHVDLMRVTTATPDLRTAKDLAQTAVAERLAGNAQITGPAVSIYRHLSETGEGEEYALTLSTTSLALPKLVAHLIENHPWENPEVTAVKLAYAPDLYETWLREATIEG